MAKDEGGFYSCYFKNEYGEAVSSGWVEVMESLPVHQKMHDKHHHEDEEDVDSGADAVKSNFVLLLCTVMGAVVGLLLAALALLFCTKYQVICFFHRALLSLITQLDKCFIVASTFHISSEGAKGQTSGCRGGTDGATLDPPGECC